MKTTESFVHKNLRAVAQASVRKEASEPCSLFWSYQPHRPEKPLTNSQEKKLSHAAALSPSHLKCGGLFLCSVGQQLAKGCYALSSRKR